MEFDHILMFFMTVLISSTVCRSGDHVFVQTGSSVKLDIETKTLPDFNRLVWMKEKSENIVRFVSQSGDIKDYSSYKNRVEFNTETFSLTLRNMQKTNSGLYMAKTMGKQEICVAEHNIHYIAKSIGTPPSNEQDSETRIGKKQKILPYSLCISSFLMR